MLPPDKCSKQDDAQNKQSDDISGTPLVLFRRLAISKGKYKQNKANCDERRSDPINSSVERGIEMVRVLVNGKEAQRCGEYCEPRLEIECRSP